jgi:2-desacetyl-2-hydroxyethyl bacteriochlorophyllide A dehydrogenase
VLGHELAVQVLETGTEVKNIKAGDLCAVEPYITCGKCSACILGKTNCCKELRCLGVHTDGAMQDLFLIPARNLISSAKLTPAQLALIEPLGIGCHAVNRSKVQAGEHVVVLGAGPIGLATIQFLKAKGAYVTVVDVNDSRLEFCKTRMGVDFLINSQNTELSSALSRLGGGDYPSTVFDATGNKESMHGCFNLVANGGQIVFVGLFQGQITFDDPNFHRREITLMASRNSTKRELKEILEMIEVGKINTNPWITHRSRMEDFIEVFPSWLQLNSGIIKGIIEFN